MKRLWILIALMLAACGRGTPAASPAPLRVQHTFAAQPWLSDMADCAATPVLPELRAADYLDLTDADMAIRIGVPSPLLFPAYEIASEDVVVIVHPQNPATSLTVEQVRDLFGGTTANWRQVGGADLAVHPWIFPAGEDLQQIFQAVVLQDAPAVSSARLAAGPEQMAAAVGSDPGAIGILTGHWAAGSVRIALAAATVPVLVLLSPGGPDEALTAVLACLQERDAAARP
jgi:hypothetical protein